MKRRIVILLAPRFADSGLAIALDVFRTAAALAVRAGSDAPFELVVASANGGPVTAASGLTLGSTRTARAAQRADVVLVPGLWVEDVTALDLAMASAEVRCLVRAIAAAHARGVIVASSCAGAFLLAEAGILDGAPCTTTWWLAPHLERRRPAVELRSGAALVVHDRVLTGGAVFAQADVALHLVARFAGPAIARQCSRLLLLDAHPSQAPYMAVRALTMSDPLVSRAEAWIRANLASDFDIDTLSRSVGTSSRTLSRRLSAAVSMSPIAFVQRIRSETAVHLLETTSASLQEIALRVGYEDPNALRRLIQRETNASPRELRQRHKMRNPHPERGAGSVANRSTLSASGSRPRSASRRSPS